MKKQRNSSLWKEVKDDTAKYEETITELQRKGQIRKLKQISYWSTLKPNTLNKKAIKNKNDFEEHHDLEIIFWFKQDIVLRNRFRFVYF